MAQHHPAEELLVDYAGGAVTGGETAIIAAHLAMCPQCRSTAGICDAIGGALLDSIEPETLPAQLLGNTLQELDGVQHGSFAAPNALASPEPNDAVWQKFGALKLCKLPDYANDDQLWLVRVAPGKKAPQHKHTGDEWTVVLEGGFSDETGRYAAGDFLIAPAGTQHHPVADAEGCVCLVMLRGAPYFTNPILRLFVRPFG